MKYKFETDSESEAKIIVKSNDMFNALVQLSENMWRTWHSDESKLTVASLQQSIYEILQDNYINLSDLND